MMHLIYVSCGDVSVFESQIIALLNYLQQIGVKVTLLQGYKSGTEKANIENKLASHPPIPTVWIKTQNVYPFFESSNLKSLFQGIKSIEGFQNAIFHVRNEFVGYLMKRIFSKNGYDMPILVDIRGVIYEELVYKNESQKGIRKILSHIQHSYFKKCYQYLFAEDSMRIAISSVSSMINGYIKENYPMCRYPLLVHTNISGEQFVYDDAKRKLVRDRYHISDEDILAVCSSGGNAVWQKDYLVVKRLLDMGVKVLNLSKKDFGIEGCLTINIPFAEIPDVLSAADVAILWRDNMFINNSASPSKYSEFASMGLYVIHNKTVKVAEEHIMKCGAGLLVDKVEDIQSLPSMEELSQRRKEWIAQGKASFGVESIGQSYQRIYKNLLGN